MKYKLVDEATGAEIHIGDTVTTFRGDKYILTGFRNAPAPSTGRVTLKIQEGFTTEYYPPCHRGEDREGVASWFQ